MKNKSISVIIPCYNEEKKIFTCYNRISSFLDKYSFNYQIMFINDGSTDDSLAVMRSIQKKDFSGVNVITYKKNIGKGYAVFRGLNESIFNTKLILDCDLSISINELYKLNWTWVRNQKIIKGQRIQVERQPLYRVFVGKVWKFITYLFTGIYMDTQAPFMILNLNQKFYKDLEINGFAFDVEILAKTKAEGFKIEQVSVEYRNDTDSSVTFIKTLKMLGELYKIRKKTIRFQKNSTDSQSD